VSSAEGAEALRSNSAMAFSRFEQTGDLAALDEAIAHREATCRSPYGTVGDLRDLITALLAGWYSRSSRADLDRAAELITPLHDATFSGAEVRKLLLTDIGEVLTARGFTDRSEPDLVAAVGCFREALGERGDDASAAAVRLGLSSALHALGNVRANEANLVEAIVLLAQVDPDPADPLDHLLVLNEVVALCLDLSALTRAEMDWSGAANMLRDAINEARDAGGADLADAWSNLAVVLGHGWRTTGDRQVAEQAVAAARRSVADPAGRPASLAVRLNVLSSAERELARAEKNDGMLPSAEEHARLALKVSTGAQRPQSLDTLASILLDRSRHQRDTQLREEALALSRRVATEHGGYEPSFWSALRWAVISAEDGAWPDSLAAFERVAELADRWFHGLGHLASQVSWIEDRGLWSSSAAVAGVRAGQPERAVALLERTRGLIFGDRRPDRVGGDSGPLSSGAPVVYLCASTFGGAAIIVRDGAVQTIDIPTLTVDELPGNIKARLDEYLDAYDAAREGADVARWARVLDDMTNWAGEEVMTTVLEAVEASERLYLVPAGPLTYVPWHAAWVSDQSTPTGRRYAIDEAALSWHPTAASIVGAPPPAPGGAPLVVSEPAPVTGLAALPSAAAEAEGIRASLPNARHLTGPQCTREAVLSAVREATMAHFACHAVAPPWEPLEAHLVMAHDQQISVGDLVNEQVNLDLAVLSACETGVGGRLMADEALTVTNALIIAGAKAAIGSLWVALDAPTTALMARFYELWVDRGLSACEALRAAQRWLRDSDPGEILEHLSARLPPERIDSLRRHLDHPALPHSHPAAWAPFVYFGA
jgi:CHAT domain-containing protein